MILAALVLAQTIALDPQSGVWFPPDGRRDDYLERRRSFAQDVKRAFEDPQLRARVCTAVAAAPKPGNEVDARLRQMRMMLDMTCIAAMRERGEQPARDARMAAIDAKFAKEFDEAAAYVATVAPEQRRATEQKTLEAIDAMKEAGPARLSAIIRAMALRPQDARGAWLLLRAGTDASMSSAELAAYVERLYRARAAAIGREAPDWENGLREVLLYLGKDEEALRLTQAKNDRTSDYDRMLLATLEEIRGESGAIDVALPRCSDAGYCRLVVWSIATRTARIRGQLTPPAVAPIVERTLRWYAGDWPARLETVRVLASIDRLRGRNALTAMYAAPEMPDGALLDALHIDASLAQQEKDHLRTMALRDCWLTLRSLTPPPLARDAWTRLSAMPEPQNASGDGCDATKDDDDPVLTDCTSHLLVLRLNDALYARHWPLARQSVEKLLSHSFTHRIAPNLVRSALADLAVTMSREGDRNEAARIVRYLDAQPLSAMVKFKLADIRAHLPQSQEVTLDPWPHAADDPSSALPPLCGK